MNIPPILGGIPRMSFSNSNQAFHSVSYIDRKAGTRSNQCVW